MKDLQDRIDVLIENCTVGVQAEDIQPEQRIIEDLGLDSLEFIELIMEAEKEFDIVIPDDEAEQIKTVSEFSECIKSKMPIKK